MASTGNARGFVRVIVDVLAAYGMPPARGRRRVGGLWYTNQFGKGTKMIRGARGIPLTCWIERCPAETRCSWWGVCVSSA